MWRPTGSARDAYQPPPVVLPAEQQPPQQQQQQRQQQQPFAAGGVQQYPHSPSASYLHVLAGAGSESGWQRAVAGGVHAQHVLHHHLHYGGVAAAGQHMAPQQHMGAQPHMGPQQHMGVVPASPHQQAMHPQPHMGPQQHMGPQHMLGMSPPHASSAGMTLGWAMPGQPPAATGMAGQAAGAAAAVGMAGPAAAAARGRRGGARRGGGGQGRGADMAGGSSSAGGNGRGRQGGAGGSGGDGAGGSMDTAVEELRWAMRQVSPGQQLPLMSLARRLGDIDSRGLAALIRDLAKSRQPQRACELFDWLRRAAAPPNHPLHTAGTPQPPPPPELGRLCDVFSYTAAISQCTDQQQLGRALELSGEMVTRGIKRNVHTFSALMNVCIKSGQLQKALGTYAEMLAEDCAPNVVTYNTLIDVYGKTGQWANAVKVLDDMAASGVKPVMRTYNTLMIACNASGQWQEALSVYERALDAGHVPNTTTYNALISAHSRAGRLDMVMDTFQNMVAAGCERSVITYSALISACEKAGQWELALQLFGEMQAEGCTPNVITFNSLITACGQGAQWEQAAEVFAEMQRSGTSPDVVTYTALISACERGGQWLRALQAFQAMRQQGCEPDAILYSTLLEVLWDSAIGPAQAKAAELFRGALREGHFRRMPTPSGDRLELGLQSTSPDVAMLTLHCWLADLADQVAAKGPNMLPQKVAVSIGRGRQRDHSAAVVRDALMALFETTGAPFVASGRGSSSSSSARSSMSTSSGGVYRNSSGGSGSVGVYRNSSGGSGSVGSRASVGGVPVARSSSDAEALESGRGAARGVFGKLEALGEAVGDWLLQAHMRRMLGRFSVTAQRSASSADDTAALLDDVAVEASCSGAFAAVRAFEGSHCLSVQSMGYTYLRARGDLVCRVLGIASALQMRSDLTHDGVLLMDRVMSTALQLQEQQLLTAMVAALLIASRSMGLASASAGIPVSSPDNAASPESLAAAAGLQPSSLVAMEGALVHALGGDVASISAMRCLKLYLERLGISCAEGGGDNYEFGTAMALVTLAAMDSEFLNYRPSVTAAAVLYCDRLSRGALPFWPSSLSLLTGYSNARTPELAAAINGAQRLLKQLLAAQQREQSLSPPTSSPQGNTPPSNSPPASARTTELTGSVASGSGGVDQGNASSSAAAATEPVAAATVKAAAAALVMSTSDVAVQTSSRSGSSGGSIASAGSRSSGGGSGGGSGSGGSGDIAGRAGTSRALSSDAGVDVASATGTMQTGAGAIRASTASAAGEGKVPAAAPAAGEPATAAAAAVGAATRQATDTLAQDITSMGIGDDSPATQQQQQQQQQSPT